jgi:hypothetical protein
MGVRYDDLGDGQGPILRFDARSFVVGEFASITEQDSVQRTFRVVEALPVR